MAAYGLYTHIASNRRKSVLLLGGLFFLVYVMVYAGALVAEVMLDPGAPLGFYVAAAWRDMLGAAPVATIVTAIWILIAWKFHQKMIDAVTGAHDVTRQEEPRLWNLLENMCISRGITMPKLKVMENEARNAFATGLNEKQYSITVTTGLVKALDDAEIEAVLGHELTHIRNGDVRMMVIAVIIAGVVAFFAELFFRVVLRSGIRFGGSRGSSSSSGGSRKGGGGGAILAILLAVALIALAWLLSAVIRFSLSRSREFLADAGAVELTKNPDAMIGALRKIESRGEIEGATSAVMEMCVDNPRSGFADLLASHPSIDARVKALVDFAGGHDPGPLPPPALDEPGPAQEAAGGETPPAGIEPPAAPEPAGPRRGPWGAGPWSGTIGPFGTR